MKSQIKVFVGILAACGALGTSGHFWPQETAGVVVVVGSLVVMWFVAGFIAEWPK